MCRVKMVHYGQKIQKTEIAGGPFFPEFNVIYEYYF